MEVLCVPKDCKRLHVTPMDPPVKMSPREGARTIGHPARPAQGAPVYEACGPTSRTGRDGRWLPGLREVPSGTHDYQLSNRTRILARIRVPTGSTWPWWRPVLRHGGMKVLPATRRRPSRPDSMDAFRGGGTWRLTCADMSDGGSKRGIGTRPKGRGASSSVIRKRPAREFLVTWRAARHRWQNVNHYTMSYKYDSPRVVSTLPSWVPPLFNMDPLGL